MPKPFFEEKQLYFKLVTYSILNGGKSFLPLVSVISFGSLPKAHDNRKGLESTLTCESKAFCLPEGSCITADITPIYLSNTHSFQTSFYRHSTEQSSVFQQRTTASDVKMLTLIPMQGEGLRRQTEPHHLETLTETTPPPTRPSYGVDAATLTHSWCVCQSFMSRCKR